MADSDYRQFLKECAQSHFGSAQAILESALKRADGSVTTTAMAAHWALRRGEWPQAQWLIESGLSQDPNNPYIYAEELLLNFVRSQSEEFAQRFHVQMLDSIPHEHPIYLLDVVRRIWSEAKTPDDAVQMVREHDWLTQSSHLKPLQAFINLEEVSSSLDLEERIGRLAYDAVIALVAEREYLIALLMGRLAAIMAPNDANAFGAIGIAELVNGFDQAADRYLHEAEFRKASDMPRINLYRFRIFTKQRRVEHAWIMARTLIDEDELPWLEWCTLLDLLNDLPDWSSQYQQCAVEFQKRFANHSQLPSTLAYLQLCQALKDGTLDAEQAVATIMANPDWQGFASALYLLAQLQQERDLRTAQEIARTALDLNPYHPNAAHWQTMRGSVGEALEWMGIFIPKQYEGRAWPSPVEEQLIDLMFTTPMQQWSAKWQAFTIENSYHHLDAGANRLLPWVHRQFETHLKSQQWPLRDILKGIWKKSFFENATRIATLLELAKHFKKHGIELVLLKGIANAIDLYGDLGSRPMADLDVLVVPQQAVNAHRVLIEQGWTCDEPPIPPRLRFQYASTYRHPGGGMVDIHWRPCEDFVNDVYDPADLGAFSTLEIQGVRFFTLNPTLNLFATILHGVAWNHLSPVRWVCDARLILQKYQSQIDWVRMLELAQKYDCLEPWVLGLQYLRRHSAISGVLPKSIECALLSDYSQFPLLRVRMQSRSRVANSHELIATVEHWQRKLHLHTHDVIVAVGGEHPKYTQARCQLRNILWLPAYDPEFAMRYFGQDCAVYNVITIDAAHSCLVRLNSRF